MTGMSDRLRPSSFVILRHNPSRPNHHAHCRLGEKEGGYEPGAGDSIAHPPIYCRESKRHQEDKRSPFLATACAQQIMEKHDQPKDNSVYVPHSTPSAPH